MEKNKHRTEMENHLNNYFWFWKHD